MHISDDHIIVVVLDDDLMVLSWQGSMHTPFYNSRVTKIAVVVNGKGYFEMACPHVSKSGHEQHHRSGKSGRGKESKTPVHYEKINSELRQGSVFVVPPGHPFVTVASEDENLEVICFEINADNNHKFPLAGKILLWKNKVTPFASKRIV